MRRCSPDWVMTEGLGKTADDTLRNAGEGFVLHSYPYKETSLLVEIFTKASGRLVLVARSARRPRSPMRGILMAFQPLSFSWFGRGEIKTLNKVEWIGGMSLLRGEQLLCGFYLNELLMRLLPREDSHEELFDDYVEALQRFTGDEAPAPILRRFEKKLLKELGYAIHFDTDISTGRSIDPCAYYIYDPEKGPRDALESPGERGVSGKTLIDLANDNFEDATTLNEARTLMRKLISHRLEDRPLNSRKVFRELLDL